MIPTSTRRKVAEVLDGSLAPEDSELLGASVSEDERFQAFLRALSDKSSRAILLCATETPKTIDEMSSEQGIPLSTCYRKAKTLEAQGLMVVESIGLSSRGKKYAKYRTAFSRVTLTLTRGSVALDAVANASSARRPGTPSVNWASG